jgi:hypothetical protein
MICFALRPFAFFCAFSVAAQSYAGRSTEGFRGSSCERLLSGLGFLRLDEGASFKANLEHRHTRNVFFEYGIHFKKFFMWALDVDEAGVSFQALGSIDGMLKASDADFQKYFAYLEVTKSEFTQIAQRYLELMGEADMHYAPDYRPGEELLVDRDRLLEVDKLLFEDWVNLAAIKSDSPTKKELPKAPVRSPYRVHQPDQNTVEGMLGNLPDLITRSPKETLRWKADSQEPYPIVNEVVEPILQKISIGGYEVEVNTIRTYGEKEDYSKMDSGPAQFLDVLSFEGEDLLHFRYQYLGIGDQIAGHDSITNNAILKEVWIKSESGAWVDVTEHVGRTKIKYFYKSPRSIKAGDIEVNFVPLNDR